MTKKTEKNVKRQLTDFIYKKYNVSFLPKYFFINLDKVFKGTYKNLRRPVPVEDLFEMWRMKMDSLDKIAERNRKLGKNMNGIQRINYDLAILLSKYDSYLEWKSQKESEQLERRESINSQTIEITNRNIPTLSNQNDGFDLSSILDEV